MGMTDSFRNFGRALRRSLLSGTCASIASAVALGIRGSAEEGSAMAPMNGPSQWLWGHHAAQPAKATLRHTAVGYAIHHLSSNWWAAIYEVISGEHGTRKSVPRILSEAIGVTALAFVVDYGLTPQRLQPGFEKHVRPRSIALGYVAFATGLAAATLLRRAAERRSTHRI
jgi:hypothetical protein